MLQRLRDKAQGWAAWVIIGMIAVTFVLFGTGSLFDTNSRQQVVAKVNGTKITSQELDTVYLRYSHQPGAESLSALDPNAVKKELLQAMIEETIMVKTAFDLGMRISPPRITSIITGTPLFQENGQFSMRSYQQFLLNGNYTDAGFKNLLKDSLLKQELQQGLIQTAFSLPVDIEALVKYMLQKRELRSLIIAATPFAKNVKLTEEEIKRYYDEHLKDFATEEKVSVEYVHLSLAELKNQHQPTPEEIKSYYHENISLFSEPKRVRVEHILIAAPKDADAKAIEDAQTKIKDLQKRLKAGESFEELAKKYSDDKATKPMGGDLKWFEAGEMIPEFEKEAFALEKKGQISEPVRTEFGFHLIKLIDKQDPVPRPFARVEEEIVAKMKQQWAEEQLINLADEMTALAYDHPDSLQSIQDKLKLPIKKSELFTRQQVLKDPILQHPTVITAAFSPTVKDDKNNSDLLKLDDENYLLLRVAEQIPSEQKPLDQVKQAIEQRLITDESEKLAKNEADKIVNTIVKDKEPIAKVLTQYPWKELNLTRSVNNQSASLIEAAFSMPRPQSEEDRVLKITRLENGDFAVLWLIKVTDGDNKEIPKEELVKYTLALNKHYGELEYELFAKELTRTAHVKKYLEK